MTRSLRMGLLLLILLLVPVSALAQGQTVPAAEAGTLTGVLIVGWVDPLFPAPDEETILLELRADDGTTHNLFVGPESPVTPREMQEWRRMRIAVQVDVDGVILTMPVHVRTAADKVAKRAVGDSRSPAGSEGLFGQERWISIGCKYPDKTHIPAPEDRLRDMYRDTMPGLGHYWNEISYGNLDVIGDTVGWVELPKPHSAYAGYDHKDTDVDALLDDCAAAADATVYFPDYDGINLFFSHQMSHVGPFSMGIGRERTFDGLKRDWHVTWLHPDVLEAIPPAAYANLGTVYHEMGHNFGWWHSYIDTGHAYSNVWDVMSDTNHNCAVTADPDFGCLGQNTRAANLDKLGWIPAGQKFRAEWPLQHTITLERTSLPQTDNYLLAEIAYPYPHSAGLTIEARYRVGYDAKLPGDAVIMHDGSNLVDADGGSSADEGAMWRVGETYTDSSGVSVSVDSQTATGFVVTIDVPDYYEPNDSPDEAHLVGDVGLWMGPRTLYGAIDPEGDVDYYKLLTWEDDYAIRARASAEEFDSSLDPVLVLYKKFGNDLIEAARSDDYGSGPDSQLIFEHVFVGEVYYLAVSAFGQRDAGGNNHHYQLSVGPEIDPHELNDDWADATPLTYGSLIDDATIGIPGDQDIYVFEGAAGDEITADIDAWTLNSHLDAVLYLYDSGQNLLYEVDDTDYDDLDPFMTYDLPADDTYYLMVREFEHGEAGDDRYDYRLMLTVTDNNEPNGKPGNATQIEYGDIVGDGVIGWKNDSDYYSFNGEAGDVVRAEVYAAVNGSPLDAHLLLYRKEGGNLLKLAENDDYGPGGLDPKLVYDLPADGVYYVLVRAHNHPDEGGPRHAYQLGLSLEEDENELNDDWFSATSTSYGQTVYTATIGTRWDQDYYRFDGLAGDEITVDIDAESIGSLLDGVVYLYAEYQIFDYEPIPLAEVDDVNYDLDPYLEFTLPDDGTYYLRVHEFDFGKDGDSSYFYNLKLTIKDAHEPNNSRGDATVISFGDLVRYGVIGEIGDLDYFTFTGKAGEIVRAEVYANDEGSPLDPLLTLYALEGGKLVELSESDDIGFASLDPRLVYALPEDGTYYLLVRAASWQKDGGPDYFYHLALFLESDPNEYNDYYANATTVEFGDIIDNATIGVPGDQDYYDFVGTAGQTIVVDVEVIGANNKLDTVLTLSDVNLHDLAVSDSKDSPDSYLTYVLPADGFYLLLVKDRLHPTRGGPANRYRLALNEMQYTFLPGIMTRRR